MSICSDSGCCNAGCSASGGCSLSPVDSRCANGLCKSDCTCCTHECNSCSDCGGGSDCKDYGSWGSCHYSSTCDETGSRSRTITTYHCSDNDGDPCDDCWTSTSTDSQSCSRDTDGWVCDDSRWCTLSDVCSVGSCGGSARDCSDTDSCTEDTCNEAQNRCDNILKCDGSTCAIGSARYCVVCPHCGDLQKNCGEDCDGDHTQCPDTDPTADPTKITVGSCTGGCTCSYVDYDCDSSNECEEVTLNDDGTTYYCTHDGGIWEWRVSNNPDRCGVNSDGCSSDTLDDWSCNSGSCLNNPVDCSHSGNFDGDGLACNCDCGGYDIEENLVNTYSIDANGFTDPTGSDFNTDEDTIDNDCDDCTDGNDKDAGDALCTGECDFCVDENGAGYSAICSHDDVFCTGTESHCFCDTTDGICKDCSDYYPGGNTCGYGDCIANHPPENPNSYNMFPSWGCNALVSGSARCEYSCIQCCDDCNCVNITLDAAYISTKTMVENSIEITLTNDDPTKEIPVELFIENEDDLKTCFSKKCEKWDYYFINSSGFIFHPDPSHPNYNWPPVNYAKHGESRIAYLKFTPSGPTPSDKYEMSIGVRNPPWGPSNEDPDGDGIETCEPRIS